MIHAQLLLLLQGYAEHQRPLCDDVHHAARHHHDAAVAQPRQVLEGAARHLRHAQARRGIQAESELRPRIYLKCKGALWLPLLLSCLDYIDE